MNISTIRPGLLVSLKTSLHGNVFYRSVDIEPDHQDADGARRARWETERTVQNPAEHARATVARGKARSLISAVCALSEFGLLCPQNREEQLNKAIAEARKIADEFNGKSSVTHLRVNVIVGRVAADNLDAVRAINSEVRDLLTTMETGLKRLDVKAVREAANKARQLGSILSPDANDRVSKAINTARQAARDISKAGEGAVIEIDKAILRTIRTSRTAFLDLDQNDNVVQVPKGRGRVVDLPDDMPPPSSPPARRRFRADIDG